MNGSLEGLDLPVLIRRKFEPARLDHKKRVGLLDLKQSDSFEALEQRLNGAVLGAADLFDDGFRSDRVEIFEARILFSWITLCDDQDRFLFCLQGRIDGSDRSLASDRHWHKDAREQDGAFDREYR